MSIPGVRAVVLFGSAARGDHDAHSDRDICAICDDETGSSIAQLRKSLAKEYRTDASSVSMYAAATASRMALNGSLFLWHLRLEGRVLFERRGAAQRLFRALRKYDGFAVDLLRFQEVFDDTSSALQDGAVADLFDLHALFLVVRNVSMLLTVRAGSPSFGRSTAYRDAVRHYGPLAVTARDYDYLARGHLLYTRGAPVNVPPATLTRTMLLLANVDRLLRYAWSRLE
jgi:predicted nucleotidyltransferase